MNRFEFTLNYGWWGTNFYESDTPQDILYGITKNAGYDYQNKTVFKNGRKFDDISLDTEQLPNELMTAIYDNWDKISKEYFEPMKDPRKYPQDSIHFAYIVSAELFLRHELEMPPGVLDNGIKSTKYLLECGHVEDFLEPLKEPRREVLNNFLKQLQSYELAYHLENSLTPNDKSNKTKI